MTTATLPITLDDVHAAAERIAPIINRTPLIDNGYFGARFKAENLQHTGAFKLRGAYNKIAKLSPVERSRGLITASSGNHAQGVAYAAQAFGIDHKTRIFVPESTPKTKLENARRFGEVQIQLIDGTYDDASAAAHAEAEESGAIYIPPYDDWDIIAGQGTIGLEIMQDAPDTDVIIVPVGGGGLISGIALAAKSIKPDVRVYGVQALYTYSYGATVADGIRVKQPGERPKVILSEYVDGRVRVDEAATERALFDLLKHGHLLVEGAGAVGLAALRADLLPIQADDKVVIVLSGGNIDAKRVTDILTRYEP